jgi:hypothetical protein
MKKEKLIEKMRGKFTEEEIELYLRFIWFEKMVERKSMKEEMLVQKIKKEVGDFCASQKDQI